MPHIVIDTNVYIDWLNARKYEALVLRRDAVRHLSAVVWMELSAGAMDSRNRRTVEGFTAPFISAGRILLPSAVNFAEAGSVLARLRGELDYDPAGLQSIVGDVLIALSARSIGAVVYTQNERDFTAIQRVRAFRFVVVDPG